MKTNDFSGRIIFKIQYLRLDFFSFFCTIINRIIWSIKSLKSGTGIRHFGLAKISRWPGSVISVGNNCVFRSDKTSNLIGVNRRCIISTHDTNAVITIGDSCGFSGVTIGCLQAIHIGNHVLVGANAIITDFDWHNVNPLKRRDRCESSKPVIIEDNVFIGVNAIVLKGVSIGRNSVIGANSVVTANIPPNCIAAGNPAKIVKKLE
jgi:acetyltransferase-like isoleucine patch superfamily enzyme